MPNVLSPRDLVFRPDNMDETVPHALAVKEFNKDKINETADRSYRTHLVIWTQICFVNTMSRRLLRVYI